MFPLWMHKVYKFISILRVDRSFVAGLIPGTEGGATGLVPIPGNDARVWYRYNMYMHSYVS